MVDLGTGDGPDGYSRAIAVSGDGNTIVGESDFPNDDSVVRQPFVWTHAGGFQSLTPGSSYGCNGGCSIATAVSDDGTLVVGEAIQGQVNGEGYPTAFVWTAGGGMTNLGTLPGDSYSVATGVSNNGKIIVGMSEPAMSGTIPNAPISLNGLDQWCACSQYRAFRWTATTGMQNLNTLFASQLHTLGLTIVAVTGISPDGQWIIGQAASLLQSPSYGAPATVAFLAHYCDDNVSGACGVPNPPPGGDPPGAAAAQGVSNSPAREPGDKAAEFMRR